MTTDWSGWLEGTPEGARAGYFGWQDIWGRSPHESALQRASQGPGGFEARKYMGGSPNRSSYFQNAFQSVYDKYLGGLGQELMQGGDPFGEGSDPEASWMNYLKNFNWREQYGAMSPQAKGMQTSRYAPFAQWAR